MAARLSAISSKEATHGAQRTALVEDTIGKMGPAAASPETWPASDARCEVAGRGPLRVDGKFFSREGQRWHIQGVTYGPFRPDQDGSPFPDAAAIRADFSCMRSVGINSLRTYHVPPQRLLEQASAFGLGVFVDIPWAKHVCFLDERSARRDARQAVRRAAHTCRDFDSVLAYSVGNEIPPDIVRWHGAKRIERFVNELVDVARQADPDRLVTYATYPPTEYLRPWQLDFITCNIYLHETETFRKYLLRLHNLCGDVPLVIGELGMDSLRNGEPQQADMLAQHLAALRLLGTAGAFVFSWTDEWHAGGHAVENWAFGVTNRKREPKAAYFAVREQFHQSTNELLPAQPHVTVVVCSYNGGLTLERCLQSVGALDYPHYDVILVDDGSTDKTPQIVARFPRVNTIRQANLGLSVARNVGLQAARGEIVAYTDSDCYVDPDWLTHLVAQFASCNAAAVGGPNLSPDDGRIATCVAASPGQPTHVLENDQVAEHIPGCNMAFRRDVLRSINGFDPQYRKAGDDVDVCWRLQQAGHWISFSPAAFVWHHRRQTPRAYLRQQAGYGEAEALLRFKHPDQFNGRGHGKWRGELYGASLQGLVLGHAIIYRGTFGTGLFQCIYRPGPAHWAMLPSTLEWHAGIVLAMVVGLLWQPALALAGAMVLASVLVAWLQAVQARLPQRHRGWRSRLLIAALCYAQPMVRSWARYRTRYFAFPAPSAPPLMDFRARDYVTLRAPVTSYWGERGQTRTELLQQLISVLEDRRCGTAIDSGWTDADLVVFQDPWVLVRVRTVQEEHGGNKRLIRVCNQVRITYLSAALLLAAAAAACLAFASSAASGLMLGVSTAVAYGFARLRGNALAWKLSELVGRIATGMGLVPCDGKQADIRGNPADMPLCSDTKG